MAPLGWAPVRSWLAQRFELSRGSSAGQLRAMEGLRGYAVFLVFLVHYASLVGPWHRPDGVIAGVLAAVHSVGNAGVDLFFVLSGYLIYGHLVKSPQPFGRYLLRRVRRIYPAFLVVFAVYLLLLPLQSAPSKLPASQGAAAIYVVENLLLLPGLLPITPLITVAWSLSYEMFYYVAMPALIVSCGLRQRSVSWRVRFFAVLAVGLLVAGAILGGPVRLLMFVAGVLLFDLTPGRRMPSGAAGWVALAASIVVMLAPMPGSAGQALRTLLLMVCFFVVCGATFGSREAVMARTFCWTPLRWLGNMSYSYYLLHGLALKGLFLAMSKVWPPGSGVEPGLWLLLPAFAWTLVPSMLLFLWVERPFSLQPVAARDAHLGANS